MSGVTATLFSSNAGVQTGVAVLLDSTTISLTLNQNSDFPGTYTLFKQ